MQMVCRLLLSVGLVVSWTASAETADLSRKAPVKLPVASDRCAKVEPPKGTPEVPGGDIFGFIDPTDIGDPCSWAFISELNGFAGRRDGRYLALSKKTRIDYTFSDRVAFAFAMFNSYHRWSDVMVAQDALAGAGNGVILTGYNKLQFDGLSGELMLRLLARAPGQPLAMTVAVEPRWSRVDGLTGYRAEGYGAEFKLLFDVALAERLFAAMNLNYGLGTARYHIPNADWVDASSTSVSVALTAQIHAAEKAFVEGVFVGVEGRFLSSFSGLTLNQNVGNALLAGPTFAIAFQGGSMLNLVWTPQLSGGARPASAPGALDLDNFERHQFRVKYAAPITPAVR